MMKKVTSIILALVITISSMSMAAVGSISAATDSKVQIDFDVISGDFVDKGAFYVGVKFTGIDPENPIAALVLTLNVDLSKYKLGTVSLIDYDVSDGGQINLLSSGNKAVITYAAVEDYGLIKNDGYQIKFRVRVVDKAEAFDFTPENCSVAGGPDYLAPERLPFVIGKSAISPTDPSNTAAAFDTAVNALSNPVVYSEKADVRALEGKYESMAESEKNKITALDKYNAAVTKINELVAQVNNVDYQITCLPSINVLTLDDKAAVMGVYDLYNALNTEQKADVQHFDNLEKLRIKIQTLEGDSIPSVVTELDNDIAALPSLIKREHKATVKALMTRYDDLTHEQQLMLKNKNKLMLANNLIDGFDAADAVIPKIAALKEADQITLADKDAVYAVMDEYNAIFESCKTEVTNRLKLMACYNKISELITAVNADMTLALSKTEVDAGDTFTASISLDNIEAMSEGLSELQLYVTYESNCQINDVIDKTGANLDIIQSSTANGTLITINDSDKTYRKNGNIIDVEFTAKDVSADTDIKIAADVASFTIGASDIKVTVNKIADKTIKIKKPVEVELNAVLSADKITADASSEISTVFSTDMQNQRLDISSFSADFKYDSENLTVKEVVSMNSALSDSNINFIDDKTAGNVKVTYSGGGLKAEGNLFKIVYEVKDNISQDVTVEFSNEAFSAKNTAETSIVSNKAKEKPQVAVTAPEASVPAEKEAVINKINDKEVATNENGEIVINIDTAVSYEMNFDISEGATMELYVDGNHTFKYTPKDGIYKVGTKDKYTIIHALVANGDKITSYKVRLEKSITSKDFEDDGLENHYAFKQGYIDFVKDLGIVQGSADSNTGKWLCNPDGGATTAQGIIMILRYLGTDVGYFNSYEMPFDDIKSDIDSGKNGWEWLLPYIKAAYAMKITTGSGTPDGKLNLLPDEGMQRQRFFVMYARAVGLELETQADNETEDQFKERCLKELKGYYNDADSIVDWAYPAFIACYKAGLVAGDTDKNCTPAAPISRCQVMIVVARSLGFKAKV